MVRKASVVGPDSNPERAPGGLISSQCLRSAKYLCFLIRRTIKWKIDNKNVVHIMRKRSVKVELTNTVWNIMDSKTNEYTRSLFGKTSIQEG